MPLIKSLVFKYSACYSKLVAVILLLSKIIFTYSYYIEKGLIYIIIAALSSRQLFLYTKYTKLNIYTLYNIQSVSNIKYLFFARLYSL